MPSAAESWLQRTEGPIFEDLGDTLHGQEDGGEVPGVSEPHEEGSGSDSEHAHAQSESQEPLEIAPPARKRVSFRLDEEEDSTPVDGVVSHNKKLFAIADGRRPCVDNSTFSDRIQELSTTSSRISDRIEELSKSSSRSAHHPSGAKKPMTRGERQRLRDERRRELIAKGRAKAGWCERTFAFVVVFAILLVATIELRVVALRDLHRRWEDGSLAQSIADQSCGLFDGAFCTDSTTDDAEHLLDGEVE